MTRKPIDPDAPPSLSPQQRTALWLFACGNTVEQVAQIMDIAGPTAKEHLHRAYRSLHARNGVNAVHLAYQHGFFEPLHHRAEVEANEATITDLRVKLEVYEQTFNAAADGLRDKRVLTPEQVRMIRNVAHQARDISGDSDLRLRALQHDLKSIAEALDGLLRDIGETITEDRIDGAHRALSLAGMQGVNERFISLVLDEHPEIERLSQQWNWSDSVVRDKVTEHVIRDMLGLNEYEFTVALRTRPVQLLQDFWAAHEKWN
jgi:DNA-binding CsgD family transcriptional regulator